MTINRVRFRDKVGFPGLIEGQYLDFRVSDTLAIREHVEFGVPGVLMTRPVQQAESEDRQRRFVPMSNVVWVDYEECAGE